MPEITWKMRVGHRSETAKGLGFVYEHGGFAYQFVLHHYKQSWKVSDVITGQGIFHIQGRQSKPTLTETRAHIDEFVERIGAAEFHNRLSIAHFEQTVNEQQRTKEK